MSYPAWTYTALASAIGLVGISGCADDPKGSSSTGGPTTVTATTVTGTGMVTTGTPTGSTSNTSGGNTASTTSTSGTGGTGSGTGGTGSGTGGTSGTGGSTSGTGGSGGETTTGGTGGGTGGTGGGTGGTGGGTGGTGGGTGGTGGETTTGGAGGAGGAFNTGGAGEGGQGGALFCPDSLLDTCGFESGATEGWRARGPVTLAASTDDASAGDYSLAVTDRAADWHGTEYDIMGLLAPDVAYDVSVDVRVLASPAPTRLTLTRQHGCEGDETDSFSWISSQNDLEPEDGWIHLSGTIVFDSSCLLTKHVIYIEASEVTASYYIDAPVLVEQ